MTNAPWVTPPSAQPVSPVYYEVAPTNGEACLEGWMNIGAGYRKKKKGPLGIL